MKRFLLLLIIPIAGAIGWWIYQTRNEPPKVPFAKAVRETLVSVLPTNGKAEPIEWQSVRAESAGVVDRVPVQAGRVVEQGAEIAVLRQSGMEAELAAAEARIAEARAALATVETGGKGSELADIENSLDKAKLQRTANQREYDTLRRLLEKHATTPAEVEAARGKLRESDLEIEGLERRRAALVTSNDKTVAHARLRDAEVAAQAVRARMARAVIRAPISGMVYDLKVRPGAYLNAGDEVATIGRLDRLRVRVYVDEPELGRVQVAQPVTITWDALPGRKWEGTVEKRPTAIVPLGSRQVGEVLCTIDNPGGDLLPGTNVNAEIRTTVVPNALTIPKEAIRRDQGGVGVFVLKPGNTIEWRKVAVGASSVTRAQIVQGLADGDAVAMPTEQPLRNGDLVTPAL